MGLGYWQNLGFVNPLNIIMWHNQYVLVMIEHFLKWLKFMSLLNHSNERITYAFLDMMSNKFGMLIETFINENMKFHGEFQELCENWLIIVGLYDTILRQPR